MKRLLLCGILLLSLCGCGYLQGNTYVVVEPHEDASDISMDSDVTTVNSYLSLKNAILSMIEEGVKDGVIRAESYRGSLASDLDQAVDEVLNLSPLGAFAVDHMTYDYSKIVSYYEIHMNISFRRSLEEIRSVVYVNDINALRGKLQEAMTSYEPVLLLRVGDYSPFDLKDEISRIYMEHPEFALEKPESTMEIYPENGTQRILEIRFTYRTPAEKLIACQEELKEQTEQLSLIYGSASTDMTNAKRLYSRLGRDAVLVPDMDFDSILVNSAYGVLVEECATCYGFAQAYTLLLRSCDMDCKVIAGAKDGAEHYWCLARIDGEFYYVDPSTAVDTPNPEYFLMGSAELENQGYLVWSAAEELPFVELPEYLRPEQ